MLILTYSVAVFISNSWGANSLKMNVVTTPTSFISAFLLLIFSCFLSVKAVGEGSGNSESASGISLPSFTYKINNTPGW